MAQSVPTLDIGPLSHSLEAEVTTIGRAEDNMVVLDDASVSGHHAEIEQTESGLVVRDLGSTNGTKVNGMAVTEAVLNDGDQLCFGSVDAQFAVNEIPPLEPVFKRPEPPQVRFNKRKEVREPRVALIHTSHRMRCGLWFAIAFLHFAE